MMAMSAAAAAVTRVVPLAAARKAPKLDQRIAYELARLRVADTREPPERFPQLARAHD